MTFSPFSIDNEAIRSLFFNIVDKSAIISLDKPSFQTPNVTIALFSFTPLIITLNDSGVNSDRGPKKNVSTMVFFSNAAASSVACAGNTFPNIDIK